VLLIFKIRRRRRRRRRRRGRRTAGTPTQIKYSFIHFEKKKKK
jgi:hypothetical protein